MTAGEAGIHLEEGDTKGRYWIQAHAGGPVAEMTFSKAGASLLIIDHTGVPPEYRGSGVGIQLVERAVANARKSGKKIVPLCPFAAAQFRKHPDWHDVLN